MKGTIGEQDSGAYLAFSGTASTRRHLGCLLAVLELGLRTMRKDSVRHTMQLGKIFLAPILPP